jgi:hypothetical protein
MGRRRKPEVPEVQQYSLEGYTLSTWLAAEKMWKGEKMPEPVAGPPPEPHPNEVLSHKIGR